MQNCHCQRFVANVEKACKPSIPLATLPIANEVQCFFCSGRNGSHSEDVPQVESMSGEVLPSPSLHRSRFALKLCPIHLLPVSRKTEARLIFALHMVLVPRVEERLHVLQVQVPNMEAHETPGVQIAPAIWHVHTGNATKRTVSQTANGWCRSGT